MSEPAKPLPEKRMTKAQTVLEQIAKLETLQQEAITELLDEREKIDEQLAQLGHVASPRKINISKESC